MNELISDNKYKNPDQINANSLDNLGNWNIQIIDLFADLKENNIEASASQ